MAGVVVNKFFEMPKQRLSLIYELLLTMESAGWEVTIQKEHYGRINQNLKKILDEFPDMTRDIGSNPYIELEKYLLAYRQLMFTYLEIDMFYRSIESLCNNFQISARKLLGESNEKLR